jgi:uncharacterized heparinase superfamily protein
MNLWSQIQLTKVHYQVGFLSHQGYIELLGLYHSQAVKLQLEGK